MSWNTTYNESTKQITVHLYGNINRWDTNDLKLNEIIGEYTIKGAKQLCVKINSGGGDVITGYSLYSAIKSTELKTVACVEGLAASMAAILLFAFDEVKIAKFGRIMLHRASGGAWGNADVLKSTAKLLSDLDTEFYNLLVERTGMSEKDVTEKLKADWWLTSTEAKDLKIASVIYNGAVTSEIESSLRDIKSLYKEYDIKIAASSKNHEPAQIPITSVKIDTDMNLIEFAKELGITATTEDAIIAKIKEWQEAGAKLAAMEAQMKAQKIEAVTAKVDAAIEAGNILASARKAMIDYGLISAEGLDGLIGNVKPAKKPTAIINQQRETNTAPLLWADIQKLSSNEIEAVKLQDLEGYKAAFKAQYGYDYVAE